MPTQTTDTGDGIMMVLTWKDLIKTVKLQGLLKCRPVVEVSEMRK
jgi:hypothetical protein